jgi:hypothetical protein
MGYKNSDPCIKKAFEDEKLFVLMARDVTSPEVIMEWVKLNYNRQPIEKLVEAIECAKEMTRTSQKINQRKEIDSISSDYKQQ